METNEEKKVNTEEVDTEEKENGKYYTEEELALLLQKEGDKRISQYQKTLEKKNRQAEKLRNMTDEERHIAELEEREAAIEAKERELAMSENKATATAILAEKGINVSLVEFVVAEDADEMDRRIKLLDRAFKASVKAEVEKRLGSNGATRTAPADMNALTKEQFAKLSLSDKQKLYETDRELYDSLKHN